MPRIYLSSGISFTLTELEAAYKNALLKQRTIPSSSEPIDYSGDVCFETEHVRSLICHDLAKKAGCAQNTVVLPVYSKSIVHMVLTDCIVEKLKAHNGDFEAASLREPDELKAKAEEVLSQTLFKEDFSYVSFHLNACLKTESKGYLNLISLKKALSKKTCKNFVIPFHKDGNHFTVAVAKTTSIKRGIKSISIAYRDSLGGAIPDDYKKSLCELFSKQDYVLAENTILSGILKTQKDNYNCGIFVWHHALEMLDDTIQQKIGRTIDQQGYDRALFELRTKAVNILNAQGYNLNISESINQEPPETYSSQGSMLDHDAALDVITPYLTAMFSLETAKANGFDEISESQRTACLSQFMRSKGCSDFLEEFSKHYNLKSQNALKDITKLLTTLKHPRDIQIVFAPVLTATFNKTLHANAKAHSADLRAISKKAFTSIKKMLQFTTKNYKKLSLSDNVLKLKDIIWDDERLAKYRELKNFVLANPAVTLELLESPSVTAASWDKAYKNYSEHQVDSSLISKVQMELFCKSFGFSFDVMVNVNNLSFFEGIVSDNPSVSVTVENKGPSWVIDYQESSTWDPNKNLNESKFYPYKKTSNEIATGNFATSEERAYLRESFAEKIKSWIVDDIEFASNRYYICKTDNWANNSGLVPLARIISEEILKQKRGALVNNFFEQEGFQEFLEIYTKYYGVPFTSTRKVIDSIEKTLNVYYVPKERTMLLTPVLRKMLELQQVKALMHGRVPNSTTTIASLYNAFGYSFENYWSREGATAVSVLDVKSKHDAGPSSFGGVSFTLYGDQWCQLFSSQEQALVESLISPYPGKHSFMDAADAPLQQLTESLKDLQNGIKGYIATGQVYYQGDEEITTKKKPRTRKDAVKLALSDKNLVQVNKLLEKGTPAFSQCTDSGTLLDYAFEQKADDYEFGIALQRLSVLSLYRERIKNKQFKAGDDKYELLPNKPKNKDIIELAIKSKQSSRISLLTADIEHMPAILHHEKELKKASLHYLRQTIQPIAEFAYLAINSKKQDELTSCLQADLRCLLASGKCNPIHAAIKDNKLDFLKLTLVSMMVEQDNETDDAAKAAETILEHYSQYAYDQYGRSVEYRTKRHIYQGELISKKDASSGWFDSLKAYIDLGMFKVGSVMDYVKDKHYSITEREAAIHQNKIYRYGRMAMITLRGAGIISEQGLIKSGLSTTANLASFALPQINSAVSSYAGKFAHYAASKDPLELVDPDTAARYARNATNFAIPVAAVAGLSMPVWALAPIVKAPISKGVGNLGYYAAAYLPLGIEPDNAASYVSQATNVALTGCEYLLMYNAGYLPMMAAGLSAQAAFSFFKSPNLEAAGYLFATETCASMMQEKYIGKDSARLLSRTHNNIADVFGEQSADYLTPLVLGADFAVTSFDEAVYKSVNYVKPYVTPNKAVLISFPGYKRITAVNAYLEQTLSPLSKLNEQWQLMGEHHKNNLESCIWSLLPDSNSKAERNYALHQFDLSSLYLQKDNLIKILDAAKVQKDEELITQTQQELEAQNKILQEQEDISLELFKKTDGYESFECWQNALWKMHQDYATPNVSSEIIAKSAAAEKEAKKLSIQNNPELVNRQGEQIAEFVRKTFQKHWGNFIDSSDLSNVMLKIINDGFVKFLDVPNERNLIAAFIADHIIKIKYPLYPSVGDSIEIEAERETHRLKITNHEMNGYNSGKQQHERCTQRLFEYLRSTLTGTKLQKVRHQPTWRRTLYPIINLGILIFTGIEGAIQGYQTAGVSPGSSAGNKVNLNLVMHFGTGKPTYSLSGNMGEYRFSIPLTSKAPVMNSPNVPKTVKLRAPDSKLYASEQSKLNVDPQPYASSNDKFWDLNSNPILQDIFKDIFKDIVEDNVIDKEYEYAKEKTKAYPPSIARKNLSLNQRLNQQHIDATGFPSESANAAFALGVIYKLSKRAVGTVADATTGMANIIYDDQLDSGLGRLFAKDASHAAHERNILRTEAIIEFYKHPVEAVKKYFSNTTKEVQDAANKSLKLFEEGEYYKSGLAFGDAAFEGLELASTAVSGVGLGVKATKGVAKVAKYGFRASTWAQSSGYTPFMDLEYTRAEKFATLSDTIPVKAKFIGEYTGFHPSDIRLEAAKSFMGASYKSYVIMEDIILYRAGNADSLKLGNYFTFDKPMSELGARIDSAILPVWTGGGASVVDTVHHVKIPKGTTIHVGIAASQGDIFLGGTTQVYIENAKGINGVKTLRSEPLKEELLWNQIAKNSLRPLPK